MSAGWTEAAGSVFLPFLRPSRCYALLRDPSLVVWVLAPVLVVAVVWAFLPRILVDWEDLESRWEAERSMQLEAGGMSEAGADSVLQLERTSLRWQRDNMPFLNLLTRFLYALVGAAATWALSRALGWGEGFVSHAQAALLAQGGYTAISGLSMVAAIVIGAPWIMSISPALLAHAPTTAGSAAFVHGALRNLDLASVATVAVWGAGLGTVAGRSRTDGLRVVAAVYMIGVFLVSAPLLSAARGSV